MVELNKLKAYRNGIGFIFNDIKKSTVKYFYKDFIVQLVYDNYVIIDFDIYEDKLAVNETYLALLNIELTDDNIISINSFLRVFRKKQINYCTIFHIKGKFKVITFSELNRILP